MIVMNIFYSWNAAALKDLLFECNIEMKNPFLMKFSTTFLSSITKISNESIEITIKNNSDC